MFWFERGLPARAPAMLMVVKRAVVVVLTMVVMLLAYNVVTTMPRQRWCAEFAVPTGQAIAPL